MENILVYYIAKQSKLKKQNIAQQVIDLVLELQIKVSRLGTRKLYFLLKDSLKNIKVGRYKLFRILKIIHLLCLRTRFIYLQDKQARTGLGK